MTCLYPARVESNDTVATCLLLAVTSTSYSYTRVAGRVLRGIQARPRFSIFRPMLSALKNLTCPGLVRSSSQLDAD